MVIDSINDNNTDDYDDDKTAATTTTTIKLMITTMTKGNNATDSSVKIPILYCSACFPNISKTLQA